MELDQFLDAVITGPEAGGWFCLAIGKSGGINWAEQWYRWPVQRQEILEAIARYRGEHNVYFTAYLFNNASSAKANVAHSRTIQADLDEADVAQLPVAPSVLVRTSPGRHQAYWILRESLSPDALETISRRLTYSIPKCDHSGWSLGHKVRIPETFNFKYLDGPKPIEVIDAPLRQYSAVDFEMLPEVPAMASDPAYESFLERLPTIVAEVASTTGPNELLESIRTKGLPGKTYAQYNIAQTDRSAALWSLICHAFRCGLTRDEVFFLAQHSANNKFADLRHNGDRELAKDVLRAEAVVRSSGANPREVIDQARKLGTSAVRKPNILRLVTDFMKEHGTFLHTTNDSTWYVRRDLGRPILISQHSDYLDTLLDIEYGLNMTESDQAYTVAGLCAYARNLNPQGIQVALSYFDQDARTLLLHTGRRDVLRINATSIERIVDGSYGVVFPWSSSVDPFSPSTPVDDWGEMLFGHSAGGDALSNLINLERDDALALLKVWLMFLLFRNAAVARPILATFGQPGSGKSTLFRKIYALLYGRYKSVGSVTTQDDFDHGVASDPFVVLDNVDTWERWLPDRLALSASTSDITKRKLYTDADTVVLKRQALVGITAHNPRFGREDVADRLLLLAFERLEHFLPEQVIIDQIVAHRGGLWGAILKDVQHILATPMPATGPQFRVEDFARLGVWIARGLDATSGVATPTLAHEQHFVNSLKSIQIGQSSFSLEEDAMLVTAIRNLLKTTPIRGFTPGQLWGRLEHSASDPVAFVKTYRSSVRLGQKMLALQDALRLTFTITWVPDMGTKLWTIEEKSTNGTGTESRPGNGSSGAIAPYTTVGRPQ